jgi:hypothetical protein
MKITPGQKLVSIIVFIVLLTLIYSSKSETINYETKTSQSSNKELVGDINIKNSMEYIYNNYDNNTGEAIWNNINVPQGMDIDKVFTKTKIGKVSKVLSHKFTDNKIEKYLLITQTVPVEGNFSCRFCAPLISGFIFIKKDNRWVIESQNYYIGFYGGNGKAPNIRIVQLGVNKIGVIFDSQEMHGGITFTTAVLIGQVDRSMLELINFDLRRDNIYQAGKHYSYETKYEFYPEDNKEYFNLKLITAGSMKKDDKINPVDKEEVFIFDKNKYIKK